MGLGQQGIEAGSVGLRGRLSRFVGRLSRGVESYLSRIDQQLGGIPLLLKRTFDAYNAHDGTFLAAALAYYFFFTLFPLVHALIALGSYFFEGTQAREAIIGAISQVLPVFEETIASVVNQVLEQRGAIGLLSALGLVYAGSGLFGVLLAAVNRVWHCPAGRPSYVQRLLALALVLALGLVFFLASMATTAFETLQRIGAEVTGLRVQDLARFFDALSILLSTASTIGLFLVLYWKLPATRVVFADAWPAAVAAGLTWAAARQLYAFYVALFTNYTLVYGSLAAIIGLLAWFYLTGVIILLGAELSAQIAERRGRGPSRCPL